MNYIPVSGYTGANLVKQSGEAGSDWYDGPSFLELLDSLSPLDRDPNAPLRMPDAD